MEKKKVKKSFKTTAITATTATTKIAQKKLELKYKYEDLFQLDIPNLMLNIWCYSDEHGVGCNICTAYKSYCVKALKTKWDNEQFKNVDEIIQKLKKETQNGAICREYQVLIGTFC